MDTAAALMGVGKVDPVKSLRQATKWLKQNAPQIQQALLAIGGGALRTGEFFLIMAANTTNAIAGMLKVMEPLFWAMAHSGIPVISDIGKVLQGSGDKAFKATEGMFAAASGAAELADKTFRARDRVRDLDAILNNLRNKKIRVQVRTTMDDTWDAVDAALEQALNIDNNFAGGPVTAGTTSWVGELGPELFVPNYGTPQMVGQGGPEIRDFHTSGTIIPADMVGAYMAAQTASLAAVSAAPAAAPAGVQIGELHVHDKFDARREFDALLARQRRIAAERS
jgi:hypothetical protein